MNPFNRQRSVRILSVFAFLLFSSAAIFGQTDQARIVGTVTDANGAVIAGAGVTVKNEKTGEERMIKANESGTFIVTALKASFYTINITAQGFAAAEGKNVQLIVGQELNYNVTLQPEGATAVVNILSASESSINTSSASLSANVNQREVEGLPLSGRQISQLYLQAPGAQNSGAGTFGDIRFSGRAVQQNVIRYDGVEGTAIIDSSPGNLNGEVPSPFRLQSSLENVQEFRVDSSNFPAEYGTGTGGQINVVTKSGGNQFHGSAFEFLRRDALDARNYFDNISPGIAKSPLTLDQFGGSFGGPVIKNKLFFFGSYERYRLRSGLNFVEAVPSAAAMARAVPSIAPYLAAFRSPDAVIIPGSLNGDFDLAQLQDTAKTDEKAFSLRLDYKPTQSNSFYLRFFRDEGKDNRPEGVSGRRVLIEATPQNAVFGWQSILSTNKVNEFRIGYNGARTRINGVAPTINGLDLSAVIINISGSVANTGIAGQGTSSGISIPGGLVRANSATNGRGQPYTPYSVSFIDSLKWTTANHNLKFGGEVRLIRLYTDRLGGTTYTFSNLNAFLANTPSQVQYLGDVSAPSPFNNGLAGQRLAQQEYYIGYGQDEWKITRKLTLSYGLRYEFYAPLREANNGQVLFDIGSGTIRPSDQAAFTSSKSNFGPRVAMTYSTLHDKTVFRGGFGIYYGPGQTEDQIQPIESDRISSTITSGSLLAFPANLPAIAANFSGNPNNRSYQPRAYSSDYKIPERVYQYTFSWQQELPYNMVSTVAYVGSQGRNLFLRSVANKILPGQTVIADGAALPNSFGVINRTNAGGRVIAVNTVREFSIVSGTSSVQNPYAEIDYKTSGGDDAYNALQMSLARRFNTGLTLNAQYAYSSSRGLTAGSNEARTSAQLDNFEADRGRNNFDVRHTFNISALYELPFGKGRMFDLGGAANYVLGGWQIGGIVNARSGVPVEVLVVRPDTVGVCGSAAGCALNVNVGTAAVPVIIAQNVAPGFTINLPGVSGTLPLPPGFIAMVNTPGGGNSRNIRRPVVVSGQPLYLNNDRNLLNPAAFAIPGAGNWGDLQRNALRGPIFRQIDLVLGKKFKITEKINFEFRGEIFNLFNTANFAVPSATLNNALPSIGTYTVAGDYYSFSGANAANPFGASLQPGQAFTQSLAGSTFGLMRSTVERTVGLGTNRQVQFAFRLNF